MSTPASSLFVERHLSLRPDGQDAAGQERIQVRYAPAPEPGPDDVVDTAAVPARIRALVEATTERLRRMQPITRGQLWELAVSLAGVALPPAVEQQLARDLDQATRQGNRVRLWLDDHATVVSGWPWEYLCFQPGQIFLVRHPACSLVRRCHWSREGPRPAGAPVERGPDQALRALIVWADPRGDDWPPLYAGTQVDGVREFLTAAGWRCRVLGPGRSAGGPASPATRANLERELGECPPHLVYFVCHGGFDTSHNEGFVVLEGSGPTAFEAVGASQLAGLFPPRDGPRVVLLDTCHSGSRGPGGCGLSVADALALPGRIVLGMQFLWPASASLPFWTTLFQALVMPSPRPVDVAVFAARDQLGRIGDPQHWGTPVLYRPAPRLLSHAAPARPAQPVAVGLLDQVIRELEAQTGLGGIYEDLVGLREKLVCQLCELQQGLGKVGVAEVLPREDPFFVLLAGDAEEPVDSSPVWFTRLLAPPARLTWQPGERSGPWRVRLRTAEGDILVARTAEPAVDLPVERIPRGADLAWEVRVVGAGPLEAPLVQGLFHVLGAAEALEARLELTECGQMPDGPARVLLLADCYRRYQLYEDLLRYLHGAQAASGAGLLGYVIRRVLAGVYAAISERLGQRFPHGIAEVEWAARRGRELVEESCRDLGLQG